MRIVQINSYSNGSTGQIANSIHTALLNSNNDSLFAYGSGPEIGTAGNTALNEIADGAHLHFEVLKDGKNVDPMEYLDDAIK